MQILPLATARATAAQNTALSGSLETSRQSSLFASLLDSARTDTTAGTSATTGTLLDTSTASTASSTTQTPSNDDLMNLRLTAADLASLRDDLKNQGFSDDDLAAMDAKVNSESGMTWGELYKEVEKKISKTGDGTKKKDVSNEDTVELMGLFGKLGFTTEQSQQMLDSLAKGDSQSVLSAIDAKVAGLASDDTVSLTSSEMTSLGRTLGLSDEAQSRLAALFNQSDAASGLSGQGLTTAFATVKNELLAKIGEQNQAMEQFRQSASEVLDNAWTRQTGKLNAGLHNDDVARKAAQVVAMNDGKQSETGTASSTGKAGLDALADVPAAGQGIGADASGKQTATQAATTDKGASAELHNRAGAVAAEQASLTGETASGATQTGTGQANTTARAGETTVAGLQGIATESATASELHGRAGAVAAEQAGLTDQGAQGQTASGQTAGKHASTGTTSQNGLAGQAFGNGAETAGQQAGGNTGGFSGQSDQESALGDLLGKTQTGKTTGRTTGTAASSLTQTMAAMDAVTGSGAGQTGKTADPALAARVARQVETGLLRTVGQDAKQLTLNLTPDELGKLSITVTVKDKEVKAVIKADNADTAAMLNDQAAKIKQTLEDQGFKVTKLEVQTGVAGGDQNAWQGTQQHNEAWQQREAMDQGWTSQRLARASLGDLANAQSGFVPPTISGQAEGLDLFA